MKRMAPKPKRPRRVVNSQVAYMVQTSGGEMATSAQCLTCEELVSAPHLTLTPWSGRGLIDGSSQRTLTIKCPHCDRKSVIVLRRF